MGTISSLPFSCVWAIKSWLHPVPELLFIKMKFGTPMRPLNKEDPLFSIVKFWLISWPIVILPMFQTSGDTTASGPRTGTKIISLSFLLFPTSYAIILKLKVPLKFSGIVTLKMSPDILLMFRRKFWSSFEKLILTMPTALLSVITAVIFNVSPLLGLLGLTFILEIAGGTTSVTIAETGTDTEGV